MEGTSAPPKPTFQLTLRQLDDRRSSMDVVCRERRREQPGHELAHLVGLEVLACFDGGAAGVRRRELLQPIRQPARSATSSPKQRAASKRGCGFGAVCTTTARPENGSTS